MKIKEIVFDQKKVFEAESLQVMKTKHLCKNN